MAGYRQRGRKRPLKRILAVRRGHFYGQGPQIEDAVTGWIIPKRLSTTQRGKRVSNRRQDGGLDYPDSF